MAALPKDSLQYQSWMKARSPPFALNSALTKSSICSAASSLLPDSAPPPEPQLPLRELLSNTSLRGPTILCASILCLQQLSGVNAVLFYSTPVLKPLMPSAAGSIGLYITLINAVMTVAAIFLVDVSHKPKLWSLADRAIAGWEERSPICIDYGHGHYERSPCVRIG